MCLELCHARLERNRPQPASTRRRLGAAPAGGGLALAGGLHGQHDSTRTHGRGWKKSLALAVLVAGPDAVCRWRGRRGTAPQASAGSKIKPKCALAKAALVSQVSVTDQSFVPLFKLQTAGACAAGTGVPGDTTDMSGGERGRLRGRHPPACTASSAWRDLHFCCRSCCAVRHSSSHNCGHTRHLKTRGPQRRRGCCAAPKECAAFSRLPVVLLHPLASLAGQLARKADARLPDCVGAQLCT